jgi:hypothetical protein
MWSNTTAWKGNQLVGEKYAVSYVNWRIDFLGRARWLSLRASRTYLVTSEPIQRDKLIRFNSTFNAKLLSSKNNGIPKQQRQRRACLLEHLLACSFATNTLHFHWQGEERTLSFLLCYALHCFITNYYCNWKPSLFRLNYRPLRKKRQDGELRKRTPCCHDSRVAI